MNILVSACLLGVQCRYDETGMISEEMKKLMEEHNLIPVCPEIMGGLATPRDPAERVGDRIVTQNGADVTKNYKKGALETLKLAKLYQCSCVIMKERSPSCGCGRIYDGTFSRRLIDGNGMTAELLLEHGIQVKGESQI